MSNLPERSTDCTPEQMGDGNQFRIRPSADGKAWIAEMAWNYTNVDVDGYDSEGFGDTIEAAIADAGSKLSSDTLDDDFDWDDKDKNV